MSGPICPECGHPSLSGGTKSAVCRLCAWSGDLSGAPRKILDPEAYDDAARREAEREAGRLWFLVIDVDTDDALFEALELLGASGASGQGNRNRIELKARPSEETLEALRRLPGLRIVRLA
jgi:hypothetical protein